jgi:hypothetical protein
VPIIPVALSGLWDSMFSRKYRSIWQRRPRRFWPRIGLQVGPPVAPEQVDLDDLRRCVLELRGPTQ